MWRQAATFLRRQRTRAILASGGFSLAACMLILLTATTQSVVLRANQIISQNWRPTYDIVVLPPQAPSVKAGQAVPADLVEGYGGGISIQQYQQIERLSGVAVAAPIAFIGYTPFENINVFSGPQSPTPGFYDAHWELVASNGVQQIVEEQGGDRIYVFPNCPGNVFYHAGDATDRAFQQLQVTTEQCSQNTQLSEQIPHLDQASPVQAGLGVFLVAAIDPTAENALIHLGANVTSGSMLNETQGAQPDSITPTLSMGDGSPSYANLDIPLLLNMQPRGQVRLQATIVRRQTQSADLQQTITQGGATYIEHAPTQTLFQGAVPLPWNDPQLLTQLGFDCEGHTCTEPTEQITPIALNFSGAPSGLTYVRTAHTPAGYSGPAYALVPASDQTVANPGNVAGGQEIAFRSLSPLPAEDMFGSTPIYNGAAFNGVVAGVFDSQRLSATFADTLNWLPEATYAASPTTLRYDAQGRPIAPTMLLPTTNPAGLVLQPPLALTTLAAAQRIEGNRLISVIRVRVSGQVTPDDAGWERVARVAQAIHDATGLRALVTLGSSPTPTLVYVPGTASAPPTGWVQERWISLGVALVYLRQLESLRYLLIGAALFVCLSQCAITLGSLLTAQRREFAILSALGWRSRQIARLFLDQTLLLAIGGGVLGIGVALAGVTLLGARPPWQAVALTLPALAGLALIGAWYPLWRLGTLKPLSILRSGATIRESTSASALTALVSSLTRLLPPVFSFALRNMLRARLRALIAIAGVFCSAFLLVVMAQSILSLRATLQGALLGNAVLVQTAAPQVAGGAVALLLSFASIADVLTLQARERRQELGVLQAVGWRSSVTRRLFIQEGVTLALAGALPGALLGALTAVALHIAQGTLTLGAVGVVVVILLMCVASVAALPAILANERVQLSEALRSE